jgi:uncharacterized membrane-anchored protein
VRKWIILLVVAAQLAVLAFMAGEREWVARTGRTIWLRTAPLDPNDPMRGAYVRLRYDISSVSRELCRDGLATWMDERANASGTDWRVARRREQDLRDRPVYAVLRAGPHGIGELVALTDRQPATGLFVRGRIGWVSGDQLNVRYGVEALFLQQDKAKRLELEAARRGREDGVVLDAEVAVSPAGLSVLKGYRWEPLGITVTTETAPAPAEVVATPPGKIVVGERPSGPNVERRTRAVTAVTVELKNRGDRPVAIAARDDGAYFRLVSDRSWGNSRCRWAGADRPRPKPTAEDIRILKPGEGWKVRLDLTTPEWALLFRTNEKNEERTLSIPALVDEQSQGWSFRIEYAPPSEAECAGLPGAAELWGRELRTRGFFPGDGRVD